MRLSESKKKKPFLLILVLMIVLAVLGLGFCRLQPNSQTVQKTIVFEAE